MNTQFKSTKDWIPAFAGMTTYARLMRLHQPVGIWLLLWPCWWSVMLASGGSAPLKLLLLFALGTAAMRAAGCIVNDMVDREFDKQVERTKTRPLASGEISMMQAMMLLAFLLCVALIIAIALGKTVVVWSALALPLVALYPWMKRITWWPQVFLGITFNWGALVGWVAVRGELSWQAIVLYVACVFWTLGYDTIYAHQDKNDDALVGVKSTARRLQDKTKPFVTCCYIIFILFLSAGFFPLLRYQTLPWAYIIFAALHLLWQVKKVDLNTPTSCLRVFKSNIGLGLLPFLALLLVETK